MFKRFRKKAKEAEPVVVEESKTDVEVVLEEPEVTEIVEVKSNPCDNIFCCMKGKESAKGGLVVDV